MKEKHQPNLAEKILVKAFPFLAGIMNISTAELRSLTSEDPGLARRIAENQWKVDESSRQREKARLS
ncbi:MAG: hypothetical protein UR89_C0018G0010 [Candidatus Roizmanbacteria bacterium GW2011_GWA2_35_8]|uniref:Uncharacterized protein n=1 Tax=Candidatus Roizmanbacteria bacterium GW2011_GWA2_35_8 TaxID=1618479 RepID=A0A0G0FGP6_9BACT|nr:MAG: hypothetical protein UR89_C0018G0010 [Candidatus Roizmanbacteria bacterium GW2011_GWA2_35_8]